MADIERELNNFKMARYGEDVRDSLVSAITKINNNVIGDTESARIYSESANQSAINSQKAETNVVTISQGLSDTVERAEYWISEAESIVSQGTVASFNGRHGIVVPEANDYNAQQIRYGQSDNVSRVLDTMSATIKQLETEIATIKNKCPIEIGGVYISTASTSPSTLFPGTTWSRIQDKFLLAAGSTYTAGSTGGSATIKQSDLPNVKLNIEKKSGGYYLYSSAQSPNWSSGTAYATWLGSGDEQIVTTSLNGNVTQTKHLPPYQTVYMWKRTA